jgi:hypothetical protein
MEKLAQTKDFCPNTACPDYGKLQKDQPKPNLKKLGKTPRGVQRYQCKTCGKTIAELAGYILLLVGQTMKDYSSSKLASITLTRFSFNSTNWPQA